MATRIFDNQFPLDPNSRSGQLSLNKQSISVFSKIQPQMLPSKMEGEEKQKQLTQKQYLIDDSDYNSKIYEWRKSASAPIVRVFEVNRSVKFDQANQQHTTSCTIAIENIDQKLSQVGSLANEEVLLVMKTLLDGHQAIFKKMGATSISMDKIGLNSDGQIKIWVNKELDRNEISGQLLTTEERIIERIIELLKVLGGRKLDTLISYLESSKKNKKNNKQQKWTFSAIRGMLQSYIQCLRIKVPETLKYRAKVLTRSNVLKQQKQNSVKSSHIPDITSRTKSSKGSYSRQNTITSFIFQRTGIFHSANDIKTQLGQALKSKPNNYCQTTSLVSSGKEVNREKARRPSISINGNFVKDLCTQHSLALENRVTRSGHYSTTTSLISNDQFRSSSFERSSKQLTKIDSIKESLTRKQDETQKMNEFLIRKIGITSLPEVRQEEESNSSLNSSINKRQAKNQDYLVPHFVRSSYNFKKESGISTTNNSSTNCIGFGKRCRDSNITIHGDSMEKGCHLRSASQKGRLNIFANGGGSETKKQMKGGKNAIVAGSHCENLLSIHKIMTQEESSETEKNINSRPQPKNEETNRDSLQRKRSIDNFLVNSQSDEQNGKCLFSPHKPLMAFTELFNEDEAESFENTDEKEDGNGSKRSDVEEHMLEFWKMNRKLVISTYLESESQKKIKHPSTPSKTPEEKIKEISEGLSELMMTKMAADRVISHHQWTKKLQNLLQLGEMKQSYNEGPELTLIRQIKLEKLGLHGRDVGRSQFPE